MPTIPCDGCGRDTNTALCNHIDYKFMERAGYCYAAWNAVAKRWVRGCGYDKADDYIKKYVDKLIQDGLEAKG